MRVGGLDGLWCGVGGTGKVASVALFPVSDDCQSIRSSEYNCTGNRSLRALYCVGAVH